MVLRLRLLKASNLLVSMKTRIIVALFFGCWALRPLCVCAQRPNILLIISDDHGKFYTGCYGNDSIRTPNMDRLAGEGLKFNNCFTVAAICVPSRAVLMTGKYPHTNGAFAFKECYSYIKPMTAYLEQAGYHCGLVGKRHIGPLAGEGTADIYKFEYVSPDLPSAMERDNNAFLAQFGDFFRLYRHQRKAGPFFLMVAFHDPHRPFPIPGEKKGVSQEVSDPVDRPKVLIPPNLPDLPDVREDTGRYYDAIQRLDDGIGMILKELDKSGYASQTIVIYTSDHGAPFPFAKATQYDAGLAVPFIIRWPGHLKPSTTTDALVSFVDFAPTILEMARIAPPVDMQGKSFAPLLRGESDRHRDFLYGSQTEHAVWPPTPMRSVRSARYKYIYNFEYKGEIAQDAMNNISWLAMNGAGVRRNNPALSARIKSFLHRPNEEFFDLQADPYEMNNLAADPSVQGELENMRKQLTEHMEQIGDPFVALLPTASAEMQNRFKPLYDDYLKKLATMYGNSMAYNQ